MGVGSTSTHIHTHHGLEVLLDKVGLAVKEIHLRVGGLAVHKKRHADLLTRGAESENESESESGSGTGVGRQPTSAMRAKVASSLPMSVTPELEFVVAPAG